MQDGRLRLFCVICLSLAGFFSTGAAVLGILWWYAQELHPLDALRSRGFLMYGGIILAVTIMIIISGGDGVAYGIRMLTIGLIALWVVGEYQSGELLDSAVWMFGSGTGYDIGLIAEMSLQGVAFLQDIMGRMKTALDLKGIPWRWRSASVVLLLCGDMMLRRSDEQARLLAVRGYKGGGTHCPVFTWKRIDLLATFCALIILLYGLVIR